MPLVFFGVVGWPMVGRIVTEIQKYTYHKSTRTYHKSTM